MSPRRPAGLVVPLNRKKIFYAAVRKEKIRFDVVFFPIEILSLARASCTVPRNSIEKIKNHVFYHS